jgi:hypothetical protein
MFTTVRRFIKTGIAFLGLGLLLGAYLLLRRELWGEWPGAEGARAWWREPWLGWIVVLGGAGQILGLAVYFYTMWPRIRSVGSHLREKKGERF